MITSNHYSGCAGLVPFVNNPCMISFLIRTSEDDQPVNDRMVILANVSPRIKGVTKILQERLAPVAWCGPVTRRGPYVRMYAGGGFAKRKPSATMFEADH
jgi:hypothetical protein